MGNSSGDRNRSSNGDQTPLELIDGPPFRASTGYSWAYSDGTASLICETVSLVARRSVDLNLALGEFLAAGVAAYNGTRTLDNPADDPLVSRVAAALKFNGQEASADTLLERASGNEGTAQTT